MSTERDTHFLGSAEKLYEKLVQNATSSEKGLSDVEAFKQEQHTIIAQYAYDLVYFSFRELRHELSEVYDPLDALHDTPDLDAWPEPPSPNG